MRRFEGLLTEQVADAWSAWARRQLLLHHAAAVQLLWRIGIAEVRVIHPGSVALILPWNRRSVAVLPGLNGIEHQLGEQGAGVFTRHPLHR